MSNVWAYSFWPLFEAKMKDDQWDTRRIADLSWAQALSVSKAWGTFLNNCAIAGALMAAEDRGYKSGYKTGLDHSGMAERRRRREEWEASNGSPRNPTS
jgi:hypothetical protein